MRELSPSDFTQEDLLCEECGGTGRDKKGLYCQQCGSTGTLSDILDELDALDRGTSRV